MLGFEMQLSDADMWAIVAHMKGIWPEAVIESQRAMLEERGNSGSDQRLPQEYVK